MSNLASRSGDDYPDAAKKHLDDAVVLDRAGRVDGCAYHAGYIVECSLRALLLHEQSWDDSTNKHSERLLREAFDRLETHHFLDELIRQVHKVCAASTARSARYVPPVQTSAKICEWKASWRYRAPGRVKSSESKKMLAEAKQVYDYTIGQMRLDGVL